MPLNSLSVRGAAEILVAVEEVAREGDNALLMFDSDSLDVQSEFVSLLTEYVGREQQFLILLRGRDIRSMEDFFKECRRSVPRASYMGSNLNAMEDVFRGEALSEDKGKRSYWSWTDADRFYENDATSFRAVFESLSFCARENNAGSVGYRGARFPPRQPVTLILTARWEILGPPASRTDSFLYHLKGSTAAFEDDSTRLRAMRILPHSHT